MYTRIYQSKEDARKELDTLRGWPRARIRRLKEGGWVLEVEPGRYMCEDGFCRNNIAVSVLVSYE